MSYSIYRPTAARDHHMPKILIIEDDFMIAEIDPDLAQATTI